MSSTITEPPLTADQLTLIVASVSCMVFFFIVILMLLVAVYRKEPFFCRDGLFRGSHCTDSPPRYNSRRLVGCPYDEHSAAINQGTPGTQLPGRPFLIGKPNHYHLDGPPPRLPSYESVRKKDRQRRIHSMIAQRFGLDRSHTECELPPSYEETLRHSVDISTVDLHSLDMDINPNIPVSHLNQEMHANEQCTDQQGQQPIQSSV